MNNGELIIHTDGGARGNPGPAACAFVAEKDNVTVKEGSLYLGKATNNFAEYQGVVLALKWFTENLKTMASINKLSFYLDSELVVRQLNGVYKIKDKKLLDLYLQIKEITNNKVFLTSYQNIPRAQNKKADLLVNKELDETLQ